MTDERQCLHCEETKASLRAQDITMCGIEGGYEYRELIEEWPQHRWRDWTDAELDRWGIRPEAFEKHRRTPETHMQWVGCEDTKRGHVLATEEDYELGIAIGQCHACGKTPASQPSDPSTKENDRG